MKAHLMYHDRDFDLEGELPAHADALVQDLELDTLFDAMAGGDAFYREVVRQAMLSSLQDPEAIAYRQDVLRDCLTHRDVVQQLYDLAVESIAAEKKIWHLLQTPSATLRTSISALELFVNSFRRLRQIADRHAAKFESHGFTSLFDMLARELDDAYFGELQAHLARLRFSGGILISTPLGAGNKAARYVLRRPPEAQRRSWFRRLFPARAGAYSFLVAERDEAGARALEELRSRGVSLAANALTQASDHILSFLRMLQTELAFYLGCVNLQVLLAQKGEITSWPVPIATGSPVLSAEGLYDVSLSLRTRDRVVGNAVRADHKCLLMITGANQGGKSTFLRSVGLAQLLMQSGMFVPAESFRANVCAGVFTHFKREEDVNMVSGKFDEELRRMSDIADVITPGSMMLFNESFAATNEREGSEIAAEVVRALVHTDVKVLFVTHLFHLARTFYDASDDSALFLRAQRGVNGQRTFRVVRGKPLPTSHGEDVYRRIFEAESSAAGPAHRPARGRPRSAKGTTRAPR